MTALAEFAGPSRWWHNRAVRRFMSHRLALLGVVMITTLTLAWKVPGNGRFPLPVEVQIDGKTRTLPMTTGTATLAVAKGAHVVIDPDALVLRRSIALEEVAAWKSAQAAKAKPQ